MHGTGIESSILNAEAIWLLPIRVQGRWETGRSPGLHVGGHLESRAATARTDTDLFVRAQSHTACMQRLHAVGGKGWPVVPAEVPSWSWLVRIGMHVPLRGEVAAPDMMMILATATRSVCSHKQRISGRWALGSVVILQHATLTAMVPWSTLKSCLRAACDRRVHVKEVPLSMSRELGRFFDVGFPWFGIAGTAMFVAVVFCLRC